METNFSLKIILKVVKWIRVQQCVWSSDRVSDVGHSCRTSNRICITDLHAEFQIVFMFVFLQKLELIHLQGKTSQMLIALGMDLVQLLY